MERRSYAAVFVASVWCFLLAAAAGAMLRFAMIGVSLPEWLEFGNLRRAHSHLMLSGWATPAAMAVMASFAAPRRGLRVTLWASLAFAVAAFPSFALWGYGAAELGDTRIPFSVIFSTMSMFTWYAFALLWRSIREEVATRTSRLSVWCWDVGLGMLALGSLGAWGRGMLMGMHVDNAFLEAAVIELFLSTYVEGFLLFAVLGLLLARAGEAPVWLRRGLLLMAVATPAEFLAFLPVQLVPAELRWFGAAGILGASAGALLVAWSLRREPMAWILAVLAAGKLLLVPSELAAQVMGLGLRIPYLHVLLLGVVTPVLLTAGLRPRGVWLVLLHAAIWASLVALLPTTGLWPADVARVDALWLTAGAASLPPLVILVGLAAQRRRVMFLATTALIAGEEG